MTRFRFDHKWYVFSTNIKDVTLMLQCDDCGQFGIVIDPSKEEWEDGFYAPDENYRWYDSSRVKGMYGFGRLALAESRVKDMYGSIRDRYNGGLLCR